MRVIYFHNGKIYTLDGLVKSVNISGDIAKEARTCNVSLNNTQDGRKKLYPFENGGEIRVLYEKSEVFRGIVFQTDINEKGEQSLTAYDSNVYLSKNSDTVKFTNKKASQILSELCSKYGIKTGKIADTGYVFKRFIQRGKTLYDIVVLALTETRKKNGRRFMLRNTEGALELIEVLTKDTRIVIESGRNLTNATFSESIEDRRTQVKLTGGDEKKPAVTAVVKSDAGIAKYGIMQHYEHNGEVKDANKLNQLATQLLAELNKTQQDFDVSALGDIRIKSGESIVVRDSVTGLSGAFFVSNDSHKFEANNVYTMSLKLSRTLDLAEIDGEVDEDAEKPKRGR
ncbi:XkdQ/YqbQ family protein [Bacillus chungangensis]|uniref:YqbQ/XkdQ domain-containing protein n=1 Tax=Bacillus chungangensis TaxID=587633 RepID=A0ABT9WM53_9BACI|nr:hypothetical protein [Bacillus chungangensis]MDQ0174373.1 hypothetical protein [Bacillus chungangensis]